MCSCIKGVKILCKEVVVGTIADSFLEVRIVLSFLLFPFLSFVGDAVWMQEMSI